MPTSEHAFKRGDVVVVPFPYSDKLAEKRRPALVVSSDKFNRKGGFLWVVMITSKLQKSQADDIALDHTKAGLSKPSVVRVAKIATIEAARVIRVAGRIEKSVSVSVQNQIKVIAG